MLPPIEFNPGRFPEYPGLYFIKDETGKIIFLGMTVNLRRRLSAFFEENPAPPGDPLLVTSRNFRKIPQMLARARGIDILLLPSEPQRVRLTNRLIERLRPYFNLATFLEVTGYTYIQQTAEPYPRMVARRRVPEGSTPVAATYGPFPTGPSRNLLLKRINETLGLRTCDPMPSSACYLYPSGRCTAPCEGHISPAEYEVRAAQAAGFLQAPARFLDYLEREMRSAGTQMQFERAARLRDEIKKLRASFAHMHPAPYAPHDQDVIYISGHKAAILNLKGGWLEDFSLVDAPGTPEEFLLTRFARTCPPELILSPLSEAPLSEGQTLAARLSAAAGHGVSVTIPQSGPELEMLQVAQINHDCWTKGLFPPEI